MGFLQKLQGFERAANAMFPAEEPKEREPTIVKDYPDKWPEIQRKRRMLKGVYLAIWAMLGLLVFARIWPDIGTIKPLNPHLLAFVIVMGFARYFIQKFECPRCYKTFHSYSRYDAVSDNKARCQHCNLQMGEPSEKKPVR